MTLTNSEPSLASIQICQPLAEDVLASSLVIEQVSDDIPLPIVIDFGVSEVEAISNPAEPSVPILTFSFETNDTSSPIHTEEKTPSKSSSLAPLANFEFSSATESVVQSSRIAANPNGSVVLQTVSTLDFALDSSSTEQSPPIAEESPATETEINLSFESEETTHTNEIPPSITTAHTELIPDPPVPQKSPRLEPAPIPVLFETLVESSMDSPAGSLPTNARPVESTSGQITETYSTSVVGIPKLPTD